MRTNLFTSSGSSNRGSALILALLTSAIGIGLIAIMMQYSNRLTTGAGFAKRSERLKYAAKSGIEMAKADLEERANNGDYATVSLASPLQSTDYENVGLIRTADWDSRTPKPRLSQTSSDSTELNVFYIPSEDSWNASLAYNSVYPKFYKVISKATNQKTGDQYTEEAMIEIFQSGGTSLAFAIMQPTFTNKPGLTQFVFRPTTYTGNVHFGVTNSADIFFDTTAGLASGTGDDYTFLGAATFAALDTQITTRLSGTTETPFQKSPYSRMNMQKGFKALDASQNANMISDYDFLSIYTNALTTPVAGYTTTDVCASKSFATIEGRTYKRACLYLNGDGKVYEYTCATNPFEPYPQNRYVDGPTYVGIADASNWEPIIDMGTSIAAYTGNHIFTCSDGDIEVKGAYAASYTIVAENVIIGGDLVNADQSSSSPNYLGIIAKENVVIPQGVPAPQPEQWWNANNDETGHDWNADGTDDACPYMGSGGSNAYCFSGSWMTEADKRKVTLEIVDNSFTGVTNFLAQNDRDLGSSTYFAADKFIWWPHNSISGILLPARTRGQQNAPWILDIDAAIIAGGTIKMDGIFNYGESTNTDSNIRITTTAGVRYDAGTRPGTSDTTFINDRFYRRQWTNGPMINQGGAAFCCRAGFAGGISWCPGVPNWYPGGYHSVTCPQNIGPDGYSAEMIRPWSHSLVVYGSVILKDYGYLSFNHNWKLQGFQRTFFNYDTRFASTPPAGFPTSSSLDVDILWSKGNAGQNAVLKGWGY